MNTEENTQTVKAFFATISRKATSIAARSAW